MSPGDCQRRHIILSVRFIRLGKHIEEEQGIYGLDGVKVIMTTALGDSKNVMGAFRTGCEAYIVKPLKKGKLLEEIEKLGLIISQAS